MKRYLLAVMVVVVSSAAPCLFGQSAFRDATALVRLVDEFQAISDEGTDDSLQAADAKSKKLVAKLDAIAGVLKPYFTTSTDLASTNSIHTRTLIARAFTKGATNPFFGSSIVQKVLYERIRVVTSSPGSPTLPHEIPLSLGFPSLSIPLMTDALVRFVLDRAQEEVLDAYADRFNQTLLEYPELETLLPYTVSVARAFERRPNTAFQMVQMFPATFLDDLKNLPSTIPLLAEIDGRSVSALAKIRLGQYAKVFGSEAFDSLLVALELVRSIQADNTPPAILNRLGEWARDRIKKALPIGSLSENEKGRKSFLASFELVSLVSNSFRGESGNWLPPEDLQRLFNSGTQSELLRMLYCGLIYQQMQQNPDLADAKTLLFRGEGDPPLWPRIMGDYLQPAVKLFMKTQSLMTRLKDAQTANLGSKGEIQAYLDAVGGYLDSLVPLLQPGQELPQNEPSLEGSATLLARFRSASTLARSGITFLKALSAKNYPAAFTSLQPLFVELDNLYRARVLEDLILLFPDPKGHQTIKEYVDSLDFSRFPSGLASEYETNFRATILGLLVSLGQKHAAGSGAHEDSPVLVKELREYLAAQFRAQFAAISGTLTQVGSFATAMAAASDAESGKRVLESFAAPPSSYREKSKVSFSIAINSFLGLSGDLSLRTSALTQDSTFGVGPWLPVGLWLGGNQSVAPIGFFLSFAEVGNLARVRIGGDNSAALPAFHPVNLISPGVYMTLIIDKGPFALFLGAAISPGEGAQSGESLSVSIGSLLKLQMGMAIDVPLLYLASRPY